MCDVMPTISEDGGADFDSIGSNEDSNIEQLMVKMLDERDKIMDQLRDVQTDLEEAKVKLKEKENENALLLKQLNTAAPQASLTKSFYLSRVAFNE